MTWRRLENKWKTFAGHRMRLSVGYERADKELWVMVEGNYFGEYSNQPEHGWKIPLQEFIRDSGIPAEHWREALEAEGILKGEKE